MTTKIDFAPTAHKHLIIKMKMNSSPKVLRNESRGEALLNTMVTDVLKMNIAIPARCHYVTDKGNEGLTGVVGLTTSHASFHHWVETGLFMFDVYSCRMFNSLEVINYLKDSFKDGDVYEIMYDAFDRDEIDTYRIIRYL